MDFGRRHVTLVSETKDRLLLKTIVVTRVSAFVLVPQAPIPTGKHKVVPVTSIHAVGCITGKEA